jgi:hypothetical protein
VILGGWPFEDQMRLEIWKKAQITMMLMIRYFMDMYVEAAYCTGGSCHIVCCSRESSIIKGEQSLCREGS